MPLNSVRDWWGDTVLVWTPSYFTYEAEKQGYHSQIILSGRKVNDGMGAFVADAAIKQDGSWRARRSDRPWW